MEKSMPENHLQLRLQDWLNIWVALLYTCRGQTLFQAFYLICNKILNFVTLHVEKENKHELDHNIRICVCNNKSHDSACDNAEYTSLCVINSKLAWLCMGMKKRFLGVFFRWHVKFNTVRDILARYDLLIHISNKR